MNQQPSGNSPEQRQDCRDATRLIDPNNTIVPEHSLFLKRQVQIQCMDDDQLSQVTPEVWLHMDPDYKAAQETECESFNKAVVAVANFLRSRRESEAARETAENRIITMMIDVNNFSLTETFGHDPSLSSDNQPRIDT